MTTKTKTNALEGIATNMRQQLLNGARWTHHRLVRGLEIVMQQTVEDTGAWRWRLALGRSDVAPSEEEISICSKAFGVPVGTEHTVRTIERKSAKTGIVSTLYVVEMYWYEA